VTTVPESLDLKAFIRAEATRLGIDAVGFCSVEPGRERERLAEWLGRGYHGSMEWLARDPERRADPRKSLPAARTALVAAVGYDSPAPRTLDRHAPATTGWISRYAWGDDYHNWLTRRLRKLARRIDEHVGGAVAGKVYADAGPVMEKPLAERAGLGWIGKNACLISPAVGSFVFLGVILLAIEIPPDEPGIDRCGSCRACLDVCPTQAFPEPYVLDAQRCISYLTIEHRGPIDPGLEAGIGTHVFGCDLCQDVCPWNRRSPRTDAGPVQPREGNLAPDLASLLALDEHAFAERFRGSPVKRTKLAGLRRNATLALGSSADPSAPTRLTSLTRDADPTVAEAARRALHRRPS
jgi:epoxyqueuosine reductase